MLLIRLRYACVAALLTTVMSVPATADDAGQAEIERYLQACADVEQFMGAVLVVSEDRELVARGFGFANLEHQVPNTTTTKFRLGSITKQFTAMAIMLLAEQGKLAVDDPVGKHLDDMPDAWSDVTIHHLLSHTSGIPNFTGFPEYTRTMTVPSTPAHTIARFKDKPLEFMPGEKFAYSNSGYIVLGAIIEKVSGKSYEEFVKEAIFEPLGMRDSGYDHQDEILPERAAGYEQRDGRTVNAPFIDMSMPFAAGGLFSTVKDLRRWDEALQSGRLISAATLERMRTPVKDDYGYGWKRETRCSHQVVSHGGGINGFATYMIHIPETRAQIVVLSNVLSDRPGRMAYDLMAILFGAPYSLPRIRHAVGLDPTAYDGLVGAYRLGSSQLTITRDGTRLFSTVSDSSKEELFAESDTEFFYKDRVHITFVRGDDGRANRLVLHQGGSETVGIRIEAEGDEPRRSFFGTQVSPLCDDVRQREHLDDGNGIVVDKVLPGSTAAAAGLERGDIILSINGSAVADVVGFLVQVSMIQPGDTVDIEVLRGGERIVQHGTMMEQPREKGAG